MVTLATCALQEAEVPVPVLVSLCASVVTLARFSREVGQQRLEPGDGSTISPTAEGSTRELRRAVQSFLEVAAVRAEPGAKRRKSDGPERLRPPMGVLHAAAELGLLSSWAFPHLAPVVASSVRLLAPEDRFELSRLIALYGAARRPCSPALGVALLRALQACAAELEDAELAEACKCVYNILRRDAGPQRRSEEEVDLEQRSLRRVCRYDLRSPSKAVVTKYDPAAVQESETVERFVRLRERLLPRAPSAGARGGQRRRPRWARRRPEEQAKALPHTWPLSVCTAITALRVAEGGAFRSGPTVLCQLQRRLLGSFPLHSEPALRAQTRTWLRTLRYWSKRDP